MNKRQLAKQHEDYIAGIFGGIRSKTSGASPVDKGDVRIKGDQNLIECKMTGTPGTKPKRRATLVRQMEKIAVEAYEEGLDPAVALRYFDPDSPLADRATGYVDFIVRPVKDDVMRGEKSCEDCGRPALNDPKLKRDICFDCFYEGAK